MGFTLLYAGLTLFHAGHFISCGFTHYFMWGSYYFMRSTQYYIKCGTHYFTWVHNHCVYKTIFWYNVSLL